MCKQIVYGINQCLYCFYIWIDTIFLDTIRIHKYIIDIYAIEEDIFTYKYDNHASGSSSNFLLEDTH